MLHCFERDGAVYAVGEELIDVYTVVLWCSSLCGVRFYAVFP